jgi:acyl-coenzyme A thioesterase PaaI-like protein
MSPRLLRWIMNAWPPFLFSGVRVESISADWRHVRVRMGLHWYNRNYVGTHFGGSLFSMTDPFWMIMVLRALGDDYIVWDKAGEISFVAPGRGTVRCEFQLSDDVLCQLREQAQHERSVLHWFETDVRSSSGELVAKVRKQIYLRRKRLAEQPPAAVQSALS